MSGVAPRYDDTGPCDGGGVALLSSTASSSSSILVLCRRTPFCGLLELAEEACSAAAFGVVLTLPFSAGAERALVDVLERGSGAALFGVILSLPFSVAELLMELVVGGDMPFFLDGALHS